MSLEELIAEVLDGDTIEEHAAKMTPLEIAELGQATAEVALKWTRVNDPRPLKAHEDEILLEEAEAEDGSYQILLQTNLDENPDLALWTPRSKVVRVIAEDVDLDGDELGQALTRARKLAEGQFAWLITHDTSYEEVPEHLDF